MNAPSKSGFAGLLRFALIEVLVVLIGIVFVRREVYLGGHFGEMVLHWQEYAILGLSFIDGMVRGQTRALYSSPFRKKVLRYFLPFALFLYVACASLCDKLNVGCLREEWFRDLGLFIMGGGVILLIVAQRSRPRALLTSQFGVASETLAISEANPPALPGANQDAIPEIEQSSSELQAESEAGETPALPGANQDAIPEIEQSSSELQAESEAGETPALPGANQDAIPEIEQSSSELQAESEAGKTPALPGANQDAIPEIEQSSSELRAESEAGKTPALPGANQDSIPEIEQSSSELQAESEAGETPALPGTNQDAIPEMEQSSSELRAESVPAADTGADSETSRSESGTRSDSEGSPVVPKSDTGSNPEMKPVLPHLEAKPVFSASDLSGPWKYLRYPTRTSILVELIGLSMALAAWLPIFTLPGLIILFKWELADLEAFRISQFGDEYVKYKSRSWYLVPYVY